MASIASLTTREYTSGSCTLRVTGQLSPLSQLADKPVMVRSRFHLQVLPAAEPGEAAASPALGPPAAPHLELAGKADQLTALTTAVSRYVQSQLTFAKPAPPISATIASDGVALQPLGLTRHRLTLNMNSAPGQGNEVELSALELADLADVLEQTDEDLYFPSEADLPSRRVARPKLPIWIGSAAAVGIAAILGSQWLPLQTPLTNLPTASREEDVAREDSQELETSSRSPTPTLESLPAPAATDSTDEPGTAPVEADPLTNAPEPSRQPISPAGRAPSAAPPQAAAPPPSASTDTPSVASPPAAGAPAAAPVPQSQTAPSTSADAPDTTPSPPSPAPANGPTDSDPSADRGDSAGEIESFAEPAPRPQGLSRPAPATGPEAAGVAPDQRSADQLADSAESWQEQLRQQLQQGWAPLPELSAPLRYRLAIDRNGTLQAIDPLSELSRQYQDRITWPEPGNTIFQYPQGTASVLDIQLLPSGEVMIMPTNPSP